MTYPYYWRVRTRLAERFGQRCRVLCRVVIACPTCNVSKQARHPMDFAGVLC